ncbi:L,D-transpeptidase family protein [Paenibacillus sp. MMS20-IR301]|uniref:L,D-transpeptidase family protein n=1 Tax=Paenibacillus sp. MMS20-IR301 TaxID=2895946 RepID=UPI0028E6A008|nr:L,D-transpeptidase family protein [Paenibacillus sp. MMS20-IR301]WNS45613.1 L,D-transpeptidase family protein [Paenibacillus sp. MMS20-IR301]
MRRQHFKLPAVVLAVILMPLLLLLAVCSAGSSKAAAAGFSESWPYKAEMLHSSQIIVVEAVSPRAQTGRLSLLQKVDGQWISILPGIPVTLGSGGIGKTREGDKRTPSGVFPLGSSFGSAADPGGLKLPYIRTTGQDYWIDDPHSVQYNQWVSYSGNPDLHWQSYERLRQPLYKYAVILRYNDAPVVPGKGSAIFLHIWKAEDKPTAGCIAMSESNLLKLMRLLDPALSPAIAIGVSG